MRTTIIKVRPPAPESVPPSGLFAGKTDNKTSGLPLPETGEGPAKTDPSTKSPASHTAASGKTLPVPTTSGKTLPFPKSKPPAKPGVRKDKPTLRRTKKARSKKQSTRASKRNEEDENEDEDEDRVKEPQQQEDNLMEITPYLGPWGTENVDFGRQIRLYSTLLSFGAIKIGDFVKVQHYQHDKSLSENMTEDVPKLHAVVIDIRNQLKTGKPGKQEQNSKIVVCVLQLWDSPLDPVNETIFKKHRDTGEPGTRQLFATNMHAWVTVDAITELVDIAWVKGQRRAPATGRFFRSVHYADDWGKKGTIFPANDKKGRKLWPWLVTNVHDDNKGLIGGLQPSCHLYPVFDQDIDLYFRGGPAPKVKFTKESHEEREARSVRRADDDEESKD